MLFFTSDTHFGHENVVKYRPDFSSVEEMDEGLIKNWNDTVGKNDTVIIMGDMFFRNKRPAEEYLERLKGEKILVRGNHDESWLKKTDPAVIVKHFAGIHDFYGIKRDSVKLRFCHYPMISWESSRNFGSILVCGHIHGQREGYEFDMFSKVPCALNAGVDVNNLRPVTLSELIANNDAFYGREREAEERAVLELAVKAYG